jgi:hypothetical protein
MDIEEKLWVVSKAQCSIIAKELMFRIREGSNGRAESRCCAAVALVLRDYDLT